MAGATQNTYYFHMKVGFANSFLSLADQLKGLWVGYAGDAIPLVSNGVCENGPEKSDLRYMAVATSDVWRNRVRIVTYAKDSLLVWKPTAPIRYLSRDEGGINWSSPKLYRAFDRHWHTQIKEKFGGIGSPAFYDLNFGENGWKVIPAELEHAISRDRLIAPIDSLGVWQHFIRNTFQPIFTLNGSSTLGNIDWLKSAYDLPPMPTTESKELRESVFGKFFRLYIAGIVDPSTASPLKSANEEEKTNTILGILNPAQMETAAMLLCQDLGLTVDVGVGKGLDVVDVKATVRHLERTKQEEVIQALFATMEKVGVKFTPRLRDMIQSSSTLRIQCKALSNHNVDGTVLLFEPNGTGKKTEDRLTLEQVATSGLDLPALSDWISLLRHDLS